MNESAPYFRQAKFATVMICLLTLVFWIFFDASKHDPTLMKANVFVQDPYDAVGSFGIQLAMLSALISFVRILRPYPQGITLNHLLLILRGNAVALLSIAVTLTADMIAMVRYLSEWTSSSTGWILALLIGGLMALTAWAGWMVFHMGRTLNLLSGYRAWGKTAAVCLVGFVVLAFYPDAWRQSIHGGILTALVGMALLFLLSSAIAKLVFPSTDGHPPTGGRSPVGESHEDLIDDLVALYRWLQVHAHFAGFLFGGMEKLAKISWARAILHWLNPRQHAWNVVVLAALGMGTALVVAEAIGEGAPNQSIFLLVLTVFIGIEGTGVLQGYVLFKQFLGIMRS